MKASLALIAALSCAVPVGANAQVASPFINAAAVPDHALGNIRGGQAWSMTVGNLLSLSQAEQVQSSQWIASNSRTQMDVWWGSEGSQMIAESVRVALSN